MDLEGIKTKILPVLKRAGIKRSSIFGSYAKGEEGKKSDVDILIDMPSNKSLLDFAGLKIKLEEILKRKVDLVEYSSIKPLLKKSILGRQVRIL